MTTTRYTEDHEWIRVEDEGDAVVGITHYAQEQLGELVYIELPQPGTSVAQGDDCAVVESVKAAGDVKSPASGTVSENNDALDATPELTNEDAMGDGWLFKLQIEDASELDALMDEAAYEAYINSLD